MATAGRAPDVVLIDLGMEPVDGVAATRKLRAELPEVDVVAVTSRLDQSRVQAALEAGASGYLVKDAAPEELAVAIRAAHRGEVHLDAAVARRLMDSLRPSTEPAADPFGELLSSQTQAALLAVRRGCRRRRGSGRRGDEHAHGRARPGRLSIVAAPPTRAARPRISFSPR